MTNQETLPVRTMCKVLGVSASGFYAWRDRPPSQRAVANVVLTEQIRQAHAGSDGIYGMPRIRAELRDLGIRAGRERIGRLMIGDVTLGLHLGKISGEALLGLAPVLLAVAHEGDEVARDLVRRQAEEICVMAVVAMRRLGLTAEPVPVVLGGGLMTARDPLLLTEITERITAAVPQASVSVVAVPPVAGAALLGLDHVGAGAGAERRLRAAYDGRAGS